MNREGMSRNLFKRHSLAFALVLIAAGSPVRAQQPASPAPTEESGCKRTGTPSVIVANCTRVIDANPKRADALAIRAGSRMVLGQGEAALRDLDAALAIDPDNLFARSRRVRLAFTYVSAAAAKDDADRVLSAAPKSAEDFDARGYVETARRNYGAAINNYTNGLDLDPGNINLLTQRSSAYRLNGNLTAAQADAEKVIALHPSSASAFLALGSVHLSGGRLDEAVKAYDGAIRLDPKWPLLRSQRSAAQMAKGDAAQALIDCGQAIEINPNDPTLRFRRAAIYLAQGETDRAFAEFDESIKLGNGKPLGLPDDLRPEAQKGNGRALSQIWVETQKLATNAFDPNALLNRAAAYANLAQNRRALADLNQAALLYSANPRVFQQRALVYDALGERAKAEEDRQKAATLAARTPAPFAGFSVLPGGDAAQKAAQANAALVAATDNINRQQFDPAIAILTKLLVEQPNQWQALSLRGQALFRKKDYKAALSDFSAVIAQKPDVFLNYVMRGTAYLQTGQTQTALADCEKAIQLNSTNAWPFLCRARVNFTLKSYDAAAADFTSALNLAPGSLGAGAKPIMIEARFARASAYYLTKNHAKAIEDARATLIDQPGHANAIRMLRALTEPDLNAQPMIVRIVRGATPNCGDHCPEWISAEGRIDAMSPVLFASALKAMGKRKLPIFIDSPGGLTDAGFAIGRAIRAHGLDVYVTHTEAANCQDTPESCGAAQRAHVNFGEPRGKLAVCASACTFILAAGTLRSVGESSLVGVHRSGYANFLGKPTDKEVPEAIYVKIRDYFAEMGIGPNLMLKLKATPFKSMYWLSADDMRETGLVTARRSGEQLVNGAERSETTDFAAKAAESAQGKPR